MKTAIIYWSGTGNTQEMAEAVFEGAKGAGLDAELFSVTDITPEAALAYESLALGCPAMGVEELEGSEFEPFFSSIEGGLSGKTVGLFGSYGWGDGEWMRTWVSRCEGAGAVIPFSEGVIANYAPDEDSKEACRRLGAALAK